MTDRAIDSEDNIQEKRGIRPKAVVLLSGGLDSTTTLAVAQSCGFDVTCLSFRYGQRHVIELAKATEIAMDGGVRAARLMGGESPPQGWAAALPHVVMEFDFRVFGSLSPLVNPDEAVPKDRAADGMGDAVADTYVPARNSVFLAFAAGLAESIGAEHVFIGANVLDYSGYPDCRPAFLAMMELALREGTTVAGLTIDAPLVELTKAEIIALGLKLGVDYAATHSCYDPVEGRPCGRCDSCVLRAKGFEENGIPDPALFDGSAVLAGALEDDAAATESAGRQTGRA